MIDITDRCGIFDTPMMMDDNCGVCNGLPSWALERVAMGAR